ncbi:MAG: hypothetical protein QM813_25335 [Verrucomicrobiota bacterium]
MASTFAVTRKHLIFGLCLPLAVLLGYLLAEPYASSSLSILVVFFAVLTIPILMRWYQPILMFCWSLTAAPFFLPGRMPVWIGMAFVGLFFVILNRSVDRNFRLTNVPSLTWPIVTLMAVIIATALATGGIGLRVFGSGSVGGKGYVYLIAAMVGYFVLSTRPIKKESVGLVVAIFFLPGISSGISVLANWWGGRVAEFLMYFFGDIRETGDFVADRSFTPGVTRFIGLSPAAMYIIYWLLARFGITGVFDLTKPWRLLVFIGAIGLGCLGGFRSMLIVVIMIVVGMIYLERMWQSRSFGVLLLGCLTIGITLLISAEKLPLSVQRSLSFLPINISPLARYEADVSTEWRVSMWKEVSKQIPHYLLAGKGYLLSSVDLYIVEESSARGFTASWEGAAIAGDYHSGPLSLIIPFGIWGVLAFGWLLYAGTRHLYKVYRDSPPELLLINRFLLVTFLVRFVFFFFVFGAFYQELYVFTGILGLSVALNIQSQDEEGVAPVRRPEFDDGSQ